jgi:hypothetical protein
MLGRILGDKAGAVGGRQPAGAEGGQGKHELQKGHRAGWDEPEAEGPGWDRAAPAATSGLRNPPERCDFFLACDPQQVGEQAKALCTLLRAHGRVVWCESDRSRPPPAEADHATHLLLFLSGASDGTKFASCLDQSADVRAAVRWGKNSGQPVITVFEAEEGTRGFFDCPGPPSLSALGVSQHKLVFYVALV